MTNELEQMRQWVLDTLQAQMELGEHECAGCGNEVLIPVLPVQGSLMMAGLWAGLAINEQDQEAQDECREMSEAFMIQALQSGLSPADLEATVLQ